MQVEKIATLPGLRSPSTTAVARPFFLAALRKRLRRERRQPRVGMDVERRVEELSHRARPVRRVDRLHDDRDAGELAVHVGRGEQLRARLDLALAVADRLGAQHDVREVDVPRVRRNVRALGHVAEVAQIALVDDLRVVLLVDAVHLAVGGRVDEVEQRRERLAQAHATPAAVADVEHALHLGERARLVAVLGALPVDRVPGRRLEVAFAQRHGCLHQRTRATRALVFVQRPRVSRPARRAPSCSGWRASARPWRASRTSRRSRRSLPRAPSWPCPGTCRCTRASRRRRRP